MEIKKETLIELSDVAFSYPDGGSLFKGLTLAFEAGVFYLLKGPSGAGKSTFLRLLNRLEEPTEGTMRFKGDPIITIPAPELRRSVLYIPQTPTVTDGTIRDNLLLPFSFKYNRDLPRPDDEKLKNMFEAFSLTDVGLDKTARNLSVGQLQRICLIRGLLLSPDMVLLDEPTSALDDESSRIVEAHAERLCLDMGKTVIMVSHRDFKPSKVIPVVLELNKGGIGKRTTAEPPVRPGGETEDCCRSAH